MSKTVFQTLSEIDLNGKTWKKGNFDYLPWSVAVREVSKVYPDFTWEFTSWDGLPYVAGVVGFFVECTVTVGDITRTQMMPVMDYKNKANMEPTATDINKSQQRALVKALALCGLGLGLWAGEDMDEEVIESRQNDAAQAAIDAAEQWAKDKPAMLKEYASLTTTKAITTLHTEHVRKATKIGDKGFVKEVTELKAKLIENLINKEKEDA